jgi:hypothetical protein
VATSPIAVRIAQVKFVRLEDRGTRFVFSQHIGCWGGNGLILPFVGSGRISAALLAFGLGFVIEISGAV